MRGHLSGRWVSIRGEVTGKQMKKLKGIECWRLVPREHEEERGRLGEGLVGKVPLSCASGAGATVLGLLVPSAYSSNATCCSRPSLATV